jgi:two-component system, OmpR family, sensor kinase
VTVPSRPRDRELLGRASETRALRRAAVQLGLQTAAAVAVVVVALVAVALVVVLHSQHSAAVDLVEQTVTHADDVVDPPVGTWLVIKSPSKVVHSQGLPAGLPDAAALAGATGGAPRTVGLSVGGKDYLVATQARDGVVVQGVLDLSADRADRDRLVGALLASGVVGLGLAALAGTVLARRAMKPLASALALQRRFVSDASHELRTPLTLLSTRAQLVQRGLRRGREPASLASDIDGLVTDADHLAMILEDLLLAADPRGDGVEEAVDLCLLTSQVTAACEPAARVAAVTLAAELPRTPVLVTGSPVGLRRALVALVDNAIRHAQREVTVSVEVRGSWAAIEVSDDGPGIDEDMLPRLFERLESSVTARAPADGRRRYGLGLALVSEVASRHGGEVSARNRDDPVAGTGPGSGSGATLELTLPYAP